jgi:sugar lactone lactonase YvrE
MYQTNTLLQNKASKAARSSMVQFLGFCLLAGAIAAQADEPKLLTVEAVAAFHGPMPTGVTVSREGRIFVTFPRWGDAVEFTVAELKDGKPVPYPDANLNRLNKDRPADSLVSVQSAVVDPEDRLWLLDTGSVEFGPVLSGGPKLVGVDLKTNKVFKTIRFPREVVSETSYPNDVRFDLRRGKGGVAYITDSSLKGTNGLIIVDIETGESYRRLTGHPSTKPDQQFLPIVEGRPLMNRPPVGKPTHMTFGSDGIAISHNGKHLYYSPLSSRRLYRVRTDVLVDKNADEEEVAATVEYLGDRGFASDGLESDDKGRLYLTDYEDNAILRRKADGSYETLAYDPQLLWPDTLSLASDGYLYVIANQLHRQPQFHEGKDLRQKPYGLFRIRVDAEPVRLK